MMISLMLAAALDVGVIRLRHVDAAEAAEFVRKRFPDAQVVVDVRTHSIVVSAEALAEIRDVVKQIDTPMKSGRTP